MKVKLKGGDEYDLVSRWRKRGYFNRRTGVWKKIKKRINKRVRKEGKNEIRLDT